MRKGQIKLLEKAEKEVNTILFENPDATSVQKQMFLHYGLYLEEKKRRD